MIWRFYDEKIYEYLHNGKVFVIYGPRQVGKTTLIRNFLNTYPGKVFYGIGEDRILQNTLEPCRASKIVSSFSGYDLIVIDEAQKIQNIGTALKIAVDMMPSIPIIASGSSSFRLANEIGEPLTGRQRTILLYPISALELKNHIGSMTIEEKLEEYLVYGSYPEILTANNIQEKREQLISLRNSYLLKDILEMENLRNHNKLFDLLTLIAFQIGREVSLNELSISLGLAKQTIERYLDLLEKAFVIKKVRGFSRNLRKEITKTARYYFFDNGIRNSVINNFNPLPIRNDTGQLWENYLFIERCKKQQYCKIFSNNYFWRTYDKKEVDHVEERDGKLYGYEFTWGTKKPKKPKAWLETYKNAEYSVINRDNFLQFIT